MKKLLSFVFLTSFIVIAAALDKGVASYMIPPELSSSLDALFSDQKFHTAFMHKNKHDLAALGCTIYPTEWGNVVVEHPTVPGYLIKGEKPYQNKNWKRIFYAQQIKKAIKPYPTMMVPEEYLYHYPDRPADLNSENYCVVSKKIDLKEVSLSAFLKDHAELIEELQLVMREVKFWDPAIESNIRITHDDKIAFIDTEPYTDDCNPLVQLFLDRIFFKGMPPGEAAARRLGKMVAVAA